MKTMKRAMELVKRIRKRTREEEQRLARELRRSAEPCLERTTRDEELI